jgi:transposase-like protein
LEGGKNGNMEQKRYSEELRTLIVEQMMAPVNRSVAQLAREYKITPVTLRHWRAQARKTQLVPGNSLSSERWSSPDKFRVVLETASLNEIEFSQYCRSKAVLPEQVEQWRLACERANTLPELRSSAGTETPVGLASGMVRGGAAAPAFSLEAQKKIRALERNIARKDAALAEAAALLTLGKKANAIWGKGGEE